MADLVDLTTDATAPAEPILIGESPVQGYSLANNVGLQEIADLVRGIVGREIADLVGGSGGKKLQIYWDVVWERDCRLGGREWGRETAHLAAVGERDCRFSRRQ